MTAPSNFTELLATLNRQPHSHGLLLTPMCGHNPTELPSAMTRAWMQWEWNATILDNQMKISRDPEITRIFRIPDSVAMRDLTRFTPLQLSIPRGSR